MVRCLWGLTPINPRRKSENFTALLEFFNTKAGKKDENLQSTNQKSDPPLCTTSNIAAKKQVNPPSSAKSSLSQHQDNQETCYAEMPSKSFELQKITKNPKSTSITATLPPPRNSATDQLHWESEPAPRLHQQARCSAPNIFEFQNPGRQEPAVPVPPITTKIGNNPGHQLL